MEEYKLKLTNIITLTTTMRVLTGLRIGGSNEELNIGDIDNPILRDPLTKEPYIPGSSIKGSLRSILEIVRGVNDINNGVCNCGKCDICKLFGTAYNGRISSIKGTPARLIFRDAKLNNKSRVLLRKFNPSMVEIKKENTINRITGGAIPRTLDRIPAGTEFSIEMQLKIFEGDNKDKYIDYINSGFKLLEYNYIGGSGSRGYGKVKFDELKYDEDKCLDIIKRLNEIEEKSKEENSKNDL
ncbi:MULTISPECIES: type III-A CRISPR-associated RAMP protein Csm3 [Clostridium]|uniref:type III-A CRISPR-associated RAMP protein Csm3 n=1 Tax=Clostridium TaxID=1485 RepID=UPI00082645D3|nr:MULTISPECIES: type III-A CRISPR-associated RAMP protein Csm3 [Clostridium]PJI06540.1 type III-A CRISPR-associated RAMP protein Csm3 [Clostridium sp. CT7]